MLHITIDNAIRISVKELDREPELGKTIKKDLTLDNPAYISAIKRGKRPWRIPKYLTLWKVVDGVVVIPRGYIGTLESHMDNFDIWYQKKTNTVSCESVDFDSSIKLRDYQDKALSWFSSYGSFRGSPQGVFVGPCGCGKTQLGLEVIARVKQPALWVTHTKELLEQTVERAVGCLGLSKKEIGAIGGGRFSIGDRLTVGLVQSLVNADLPVDKWGLIMVDESHHVPAQTFDKVVNQLPATYRYGLSATPDREDGLTKAMLAIMGPILHTIPREAVPTVTPSLEVVKTGYKPRGESYTEILDDLNNVYRNGIIVDKVIESLSDDVYCLVLSERIEHLCDLETMLASRCPHVTTEVITGQMGKKDRQRIMADVLGRKVRVLFATQLAREGLDIPHLNRLFLAMPKRAKGAVQQEIGRVMRPAPGKTDAVVYDFLDNHGMMQAQFRERKKVYRGLGMI